jgi:2'-5' RNA ligase
MSNLVIVALPSKDDYVNKISTEKVPHMTLLFLGEDSTKVKNLDKIIGFVEHAANTTLTRFSLDVDRRDTLGPDLADTLVFSKNIWSDLKRIEQFRSNLLKENNIRLAYDSTTQFPEWIPHITLGYPETPAKPDERDYPGINYVSFDRIAVWFKDYEGVEFPLKQYYGNVDMDMAMSNIADDILVHFGVKGMKWGVRRDRSSGVTVSSRRKKLRTSGGYGRPAHPDAVRVSKIGQVGKKSGLKALSNEELNAYTHRLNLEGNVKRLNYANSNAAKRFALTVLGQTGKNQASALANDVASAQVKKHLAKRLVKAGAVAAA